ncbi:MAG: methionine biosynthesis protein MetW [Halothiobacillaceae bacterium]
MRLDHAIISEWIAPNSRVLDLGCGDCTLLRELRNSRNTTGYGLELGIDKLAKCVEGGTPVIQANLDQGLSPWFEAQSFDYVIMTHTLQAMRHPEQLLKEMLHVGREAIITFPNMGYWKNRLQFALGGRMPVTKTLPYGWFDTPNIHLCTVRDFEVLCEEQGLRILDREMVDSQQRSRPLMRLMPNLLAETAVYRLAAK